MLICGYSPQSGRSLKKKSFRDDLKVELDMHSTGDYVIFLGDLYGHFGRHIDGFSGVHGGYGIGQKNLDG